MVVKIKIIVIGSWYSTWDKVSAQNMWAVSYKVIHAQELIALLEQNFLKTLERERQNKENREAGTREALELEAAVLAPVDFQLWFPWSLIAQAPIADVSLH